MTETINGVPENKGLKGKKREAMEGGSGFWRPFLNECHRVKLQS